MSVLSPLHRASAALLVCAVASATHTAPSSAGPLTAPSPVLTASCLDAGRALSVEEQRLTARLPDSVDPSRLAPHTFAQYLIDGGGFENVGPGIVHRLCGVRRAADAERLAAHEGTRLWKAAVARVQGRSPRRGDLPRGDDRPLYWTRLQVTAALRQWTPRFDLSAAQRERLIDTFEKTSRGMTDVSFPAGRRTARVIVSGFDPYTLDGGDKGTADGAAGNNIRHGNPSGATALALDGTTRTSSDGRRQVVEAYMLPVNYTEFAQGWIEDTVGPWMRPGRRAVTASVTLSQGREGRFDLEVFNGRYHGVSAGNDGSLPCPPVGGTPQLAVHNPGCNTTPPARWGNPRTFNLFDPPQWTLSSLPMTHLVNARIGHSLTPPPGAVWARGAGFPVRRNTEFTEFPDCSSPQRATRNAPAAPGAVPAQPGTPPTTDSCAYAGGGGTYLSNESAYRNTLLRDRLGRRIPAGHIHTPIMQHFDDTNRYAPSDATFDAWRTSIVTQTSRLVRAVGAAS